MDIKEARTAAHLTQQRLSDISGIPKRTIEDWEGERRKCPDWTERLVIGEIRRIGKMMQEKRYIVVDTDGHDEWHTPFTSLEEANDEADTQWKQLTKNEQKRGHIYVATVTGADLNEDCFEDGEITDWDGFFQCDLEGFDSDKLLTDVVPDAEALYDGGWRAKDKDQLIDEYDLTDEDAEDLCDALQDLEDRID